MKTDNKTIKCPKCKQNLIISVTYKRGLFKLTKVYTAICVCCDYMNTKEIKISKDEYKNSFKEREILALNTTNKSYNQVYSNN